MSNYIINGGSHSITEAVETLEAHGGVYYIRGNIGNLTMHGGIVYDQRPSNRVEFRTDEMTAYERRKYERKIESLEIKLANNQHEVLTLRKKLRELQAKEDEQIPSDDVLVRRIITLQNELEAEKSAHKNEVEELVFRLNTAIEEANGIHRNYYEDIERKYDHRINDEMFDVLFTFINLYPFTTDGDITKEYGITREQVRTVAKILKMAKSKEARQEAVEYLRKQDKEMIQRRGGSRINHFARPVEQVAKNGRVINTFISTTDAMEATGCSAETIRKYCQLFGNRKKRTYTKEGFTFRYKV